MAEKQKMTPSEAIVEQLRMEGVEYCAGIVGSAFMDMLDLFPAAGIRFIACRDEHTAGHMMDAYNRVTGAPVRTALVSPTSLLPLLPLIRLTAQC